MTRSDHILVHYNRRTRQHTRICLSLNKQASDYRLDDRHFWTLLQLIAAQTSLILNWKFAPADACSEKIGSTCHTFHPTAYTLQSTLGLDCGVQVSIHDAGPDAEKEAAEWIEKQLSGPFVTILRDFLAVGR